MKFFIVSDIHSFFTEFQVALQAAGFDENDENHTLVVLGDLLDRGPDPLKCLQFVNRLPRKILIRGNHEDLLEELIARQAFKAHDYHNGTAETVLHLSPTCDIPNACLELENHVELQTYLKSLVDFYELPNAVFVHGWIPLEENWQDGNWEDARWHNGMSCWNTGSKLAGKTIYCGHFHTSWGHHFLHSDGMEWPNLRSTNPDHRYANFDPFIDDGICAIDACTAFSHKVNCVILDVPVNII